MSLATPDLNKTMFPQFPHIWTLLNYTIQSSSENKIQKLKDNDNEDDK